MLALLLSALAPACRAAVLQLPVAPRLESASLSADAVPAVNKYGVDSAVSEADPWRMQYFAHIPFEPGVLVPTEDADAMEWNSAHAWIYDKLEVARSQGLEAGTHEQEPPSYPVFAKPITNLKGMGVDSGPIRSPQEFRERVKPGHFWAPLLEGRHVSSDLAVVDGEPRWWRHVTGIPGVAGTFDHWKIQAAAEPGLEARVGDWVRRRFKDYTGMINVETIGGSIIEGHLRFADQWPDLYGAGWVEALVRLYREKRWDYADSERRDGYSVVLFGPHGRQYRHPPRELVDEVRAMPGVTSVQVTFHEDKPADAHAAPPGGFRLAIVNSWDLASGRAALARLAERF